MNMTMEKAWILGCRGFDDFLDLQDSDDDALSDQKRKYCLLLCRFPTLKLPLLHDDSSRSCNSLSPIACGVIPSSDRSETQG
jgi:hypothetical protein